MKLLYGLLISCLFAISCAPGAKTGSKRSAKILQAITPPDSVLQKQRAGVDFIANGAEISPWKLEMDFDKSFTFSSSDNTAFNIPAVASTRLQNDNADSWASVSVAEKILIIVYDKDCPGEKVNSRNAKLVEVTVGNKRYTGCGHYLYDPQVNNTWVLESIDNSKIPAADYPNKPRLVFDLLKNEMSGTDGCNNINSAINMEGNRIRFSAFTSTKKGCPNNVVAKKFSENLSGQLVDYYFRDGKMILYLGDDSRLTFVKM